MRQHGGVAPSTPAPTANARVRQTIGDMGRSLGLVFVFVAVVLFVSPARSLVLPGNGQKVQTVSYAEEVRAATRLTPREVLAPSGLPGSWRPTSARVGGGNGDPMTLHIGYVTPAGQYAALEETDGAAAGFLRGLLGKAGARTVDGRVSVGSAVWLVRHDVKGQRALTRTTGGLTLVVTGSAKQSELAALAAALRPAPKQ